LHIEEGGGTDMPYYTLKREKTFIYREYYILMRRGRGDVIY